MRQLALTRSQLLLALLVCWALPSGVGCAPDQDSAAGFTDHGIAAPFSISRGTVATTDGAGRDVVLVWLSDHRGGYALLMVDAETGRGEQFPMPFDQRGDTIYFSLLSSRNRLYTLFGDHFVEFDPTQRAFTFQSPVRPHSAMSMTEDDHGDIWAATFPTAGLVRFNPETRKLTDFGSVRQEDWTQYPRRIATDDLGWVYVGTGYAASQITAFNPATREAGPLLGEVERAQGLPALYPGVDGKVYGAPLATSNDRWYEFYRGQAKLLGASPGVKRKPIVAGAQQLLHTRFPTGRTLQSLDLTERSLVTVAPQATDTTRVSFDYQTEGAAILAVAASPQGALCGGTMFPFRFFNYDSAKNRWTNRECLGQWNTLARQGDHLFVGAYGQGMLLEWAPEREWTPTKAGDPTSNPLLVTTSTPTVYRPRALLACPDDRTLVMGGSPPRGRTGAGLLLWDRETQTPTLLPDTAVGPDQSTMSLVALGEGKVLGGTTTAPAGGGVRKAREAELYLLDLATRKVQWHAAVLPGVQAYSDLCSGAHGLVYGLADRNRFFVLDPVQRQVVYEQSTGASFGHAPYQQGPRYFVRGPGETVYVLFERAIAQVDAVDHHLHLLTKAPVPIGPGGDYLEGRIYFASGSHLYSYTLPAQP